MAMRVVTLDRLEDFIEDKVGREQTLLKGSECVKFIDSETSETTCYLPNSQVSNLDDEYPFLKFRDQISGVLAVCGEIVPDEDIIPYTYLLDL